MKPSFHARLLNGPFEDPSLYVRVLREGRALLFDSGFTTRLSNRDILKISDVFISHTHIDHFIGFDSILRLHLIKESPLRLYGPRGFIENIKGKLLGYTWNLIESYPTVIKVAEVDGNTIRRAVFRAVDSFRYEDEGTESFNGVLLKNASIKISASVLDHKVPSLAFSIEEDFHINIDKAKLEKLGLPVGPWLKGFKDAIRRNDIDRTFTVSGRAYTFSELKEIAAITRGQKVSYVTDAIGSEENIRKIRELVRGSDMLYIEAYFLQRDNDRAKERYHLTAREAGRMAREAGVGRMVLFHFSPKYIDNPEEILKEAEEEFRGSVGYENSV